MKKIINNEKWYDEDDYEDFDITPQPIIIVQYDEQDDDEDGDGDLGKLELKPDNNFLNQHLGKMDVLISQKEKELIKELLDNTDEYILGSWEYDKNLMKITNNKKKQNIYLREIDSSLKMIKLISALGIKEGWEVDNLIKILDTACQATFGKNFYYIATSDIKNINWERAEFNKSRHHY